MRFIARFAAPLSVVAAFAILAPVAALGANACQADVAKFCPDMKPGSGRAMACLKEHQAELSPECQQQIAKAKAKVDAFREACGPDAQKFCPGVKPRGGALMKCLGGHQAELAPACQQMMAGAHEKMASFKKACGGDVKKLCPGVQPGEGRIIECLKTNEAQLSPACKTMMSK